MTLTFSPDIRTNADGSVGPWGHLQVNGPGVNHRYAVDLHAINSSAWTLLSAAERDDAVVKISEAIAGKAVAPHPPAPPLPSLVEVKQRAKARLAADAEKQRQKYITPGAGKAMIYLRKCDEAEKFLIDPLFSGAFLNAEATRTGKTKATIANEWKTKSDQWHTIGAGIETTLFNAAEAIDAAATAAEANAVVAGVVWP